MVSYIEIIAKGVIPGIGLAQDIYKNYTKETSSIDGKSNTDTVSAAAHEAQITAEVLKYQAQVEQENAIATRILLAEEVEIEEHYDINGKGTLGLKGDDAGVTLGLNTEGRKVSKRVIKFKGFNQHMSQEILSGIVGMDKYSKE